VSDQSVLKAGLSLRPVEDIDAEGVIELYDACWGEYEGMILDTEVEMAHLHHVATHFSSLNGRAWVVESDGSQMEKGIVGSVAWRPWDERRVELQMLYVLPRARRNGIASYLVRMVERDVADAGYPDLELWSDTRFEDAHRLYRSLEWSQPDETRYLGDLSESWEYHFLSPTWPQR
jgi:GNAT superfamily N-acetyltransferase